jgi:hypothetical protein
MKILGLQPELVQHFLHRNAFAALCKPGLTVVKAMAVLLGYRLIVWGGVAGARRTGSSSTNSRKRTAVGICESSRVSISSCAWFFSETPSIFFL